MEALFENTNETPISIDTSLHAENRQRVVDAVCKEKDVNTNGIVLLKGKEDEVRDNTDNEKLFRQESYFFWTFGVNVPDLYGALDLKTRESILFIPRLPDSFEIWMGHIKTPQEFKSEFGVDHVQFTDEIAEYLQKRDPEVVYTLQGYNTDSNILMPSPSFPDQSKYRVDNGKLFPIMTELRVIKTEKERALLRSVNRWSSRAHMAVLRYMQPGKHERSAEAVFKFVTHSFGDARYFAYTPICGSGPNAAVLHYGHAGAPNDRQTNDGDIMLIDMGAERHCYVSDITLSFPVNGKFTDDQKIVYKAVNAARIAVLKSIKPGVYWPDLHTLAYRVILESLKQAGVVNGDVDEMLEDNLGSVFMPHGLGHLLGVDVHDVGGRPKGSPDEKRFGHASVRLRRKLQEGMVLTVEPGCYFIDALLDAALKNPDHNKYLNKDAIARFRGFGGVRLEDNVYVTRDGFENFTVVPRTIEQVEQCCRGELNDLDQVDTSI